MAGIVEDRFERERNYSKADVLLFDIKVDVVPYITFVNAFDSNPSFFFPAENLRFVYLERKNIVAQVISRKIAEKNGVWGVVNSQLDVHRRSQFYRQFGTDPSSYSRLTPLDVEYRGMSLNKITIDVDSFEFELLFVEKNRDLIMKSLHNVPFLQLYYEELFDLSGRFGNGVQNKLPTGLVSTYLNSTRLQRSESKAVKTISNLWIIGMNSFTGFVALNMSRCSNSK